MHIRVGSRNSGKTRTLKIEQTLIEAAIANARQDADLFFSQENKNLEGEEIHSQAQRNADGYREPMSSEERNIYVTAWIECYSTLAGLANEEL